MADVIIDLKYNGGFSWYKKLGYYFKGYLFDNNKFLEGISAIDYLEKVIDSAESLEKAIKGLVGIFSFVYGKDNIVIVCSDRVRTFPIFYSYSEGRTIISDDAQVCTGGEKNIDENSSVEFLHTGYVTGNKTLLDNVYQVRAGEFIVFNSGKIEAATYHSYISTATKENDIVSSSEKFIKILGDIFDRLINSLSGKTAVIPLSGGYDSRLIAVMLKNKGFEDVICFTYGRKDNLEVRISKKVAERLGYKWYFIEYNEELIKDYIITDEFKEYFKFSGNYTSMFYMQEYFAVKELKKMLPDNSVFIPGHSGDFFGGSHLDDNIIKSATIDEIVNQTLQFQEDNFKS